ncbi:hypothetical protein FACS1894211_03420 [Clostridia bacterium]|nr:hypothetical protein FACS1894211_03420 [Clostridia bacterium]
MADFFDPVNLWLNFDPALTDADLNILSEYERDGIQYREFFFSPFPTAVPGVAPTRAFGIFARSAADAGKTLTPVFLPGDADTGIDREWLAAFCRKGYAALTVDLRGSGEGAARGATFYAAADAAANYALIDDLYTTGVVKKSCWYIWSALCMRTLSLAETFPDLRPRPLLAAKGIAASVGMILAAVDKRLAGAALLFCNEPQTYAGDDGAKRFAGIFSAIANAPLVKCPVLFMGATNDDRFSFANFYEIFARIPPETNSVMSMSAGLCREVGFAESTDLDLFFEAAAADDLRLSKPTIHFTVSENKLYFSIKPCAALPVKHCILYCAYGGEARDRNWERKEAFAGADGEFITAVDSFDIPDPIYIYGAVHYEFGLSLCTRVIKKTAAELNAPCKPLVHSHLLYAPGGGRDSFTTVDNGCLIHRKENVELARGPLGIEGARAGIGKLATFKPGDPRFSPLLAGSAIQINVYSPAAGTFVVVLKDGKDVRYYSKETPLCGGEIWQKIVLDPSAFKTSEKVALVDFSDIKLLYFERPADILVSSILWT